MAGDGAAEKANPGEPRAVEQRAVRQEDLLTLYAMFKADDTRWLDLHRAHLQQHTTLITAILGSALAAAYTLKTSPWLLAIALAPLINTLLCVTARDASTRYYQRHLENVTVEAKLEAALGLTSPQQDGGAPPWVLGESHPLGTQFPGDCFWVPNRWIAGRPQSTSQEFVEHYLKKGANGPALRVLLLLLIVNIILGLLVCVVGAYNIHAAFHAQPGPARQLQTDVQAAGGVSGGAVPERGGRLSRSPILCLRNSTRADWSGKTRFIGTQY